MSMKELPYAQAFRDVIRELISKELNNLRPTSSLATVDTINTVAGTCNVFFPGDTVSVPVKMYAIQPTVGGGVGIGDVVQIEGESGRRFISRVVKGEATFKGAAGGGSSFARSYVSSATVTTATTPLTIISAPSVVGDGVKRFKITACAHGIVGPSPHQVIIKLQDGATVLTSQFRPSVNAVGGGFCLTTTNVPSVGTHTYKLTIWRDGMDVSIMAVADAPIEIMVEQIS